MPVSKPPECARPPASPSHIVMPPYVLRRDFLEEATAAGLLDYALTHESAFVPTKVGEGFKPNIRVSLGTRDLGPYRPLFEAKLRALVHGLVDRRQIMPMGDPTFEFEMVAHRDGAYYTRHIDTRTDSDQSSMRVLSGVYYFHNRPKAFSGGALRLYAVGDTKHQMFTNIEPDHNTLVVFPSWMPHEVMPVSCPSHRFADSRFAVNCWVRRQSAGSSTGFGGSMESA